MTRTFKPVWVILFAAGGVLAVAGLSKITRPKEIIPWQSDFAVASSEAARTGKPVFAYFTADWCEPCQSLKRTTWADERVEAALRAFVPVKIDVDDHPDLAGRFGASRVPAFFVLDEAGGVRRRGVGALPPEEFLDWLKGG